MSTPVNGPKVGPLICVDGQGYGEHSLKQLLKKHADLERENATQLREIVRLCAECDKAQDELIKLKTTFDLVLPIEKSRVLERHLRAIVDIWDGPLRHDAFYLALQDAILLAKKDLNKS